MKRQRITGIHFMFLGVVMLGIIIAGCQGNGEAPIGGQVDKELSTWEQIKQRGSIRYGVVAGSAPEFIKDPNTGEWSGYSVAMGQEIAEAMGVQLELVETTWGNVVAALQASQIDVIAPLGLTPQRTLAIDFTLYPMNYDAFAVLTSEDRTVQTWDELESGTIAVVMGGSQDSWATERFPDASIQRYPGADEAFAAIPSGQAEFGIFPMAPAFMYQHELGSGTVSIPKPFVYRSGHLAVRQEPDKTWRDFLSFCAFHYYTTGKIQAWYDDALQSMGIDPRTAPSIVKEEW